MIGSKAWLDKKTGKVYLSPLLIKEGGEYVEVTLKHGPWEGLIEVIYPNGESFLIGSHELVG